MNTHKNSPLYYHGGVSGIAVGEYILPRHFTENCSNCNPDNPRNTGQVYITPSLRVAEGYALSLSSEYGLGTVYWVKPMGEVMQSVFINGLVNEAECICSAARVVCPVKVITQQDRDAYILNKRKLMVMACAVSFLCPSILAAKIATLPATVSYLRGSYIPRNGPFDTVKA
jgi:hypothetical protein